MATITDTATAPVRYRDVTDLHERIDAVSHLTGADAARELSTLITQVHDVELRWLSEQRSRVTADMHYLGDQSMRSLAGVLNYSVNAVSLWLKGAGPTHYVTVRRDGEDYVVEAVPAGRNSLRQLRQAGRRIAPSTWRMDEGDRPRADIDGKALWTELASSAEVQD